MYIIKKKVLLTDYEKVVNESKKKDDVITSLKEDNERLKEKYNEERFNKEQAVLLLKQKIKEYQTLETKYEASVKINESKDMLINKILTELTDIHKSNKQIEKNTIQQVISDKSDRTYINRIEFPVDKVKVTVFLRGPDSRYKTIKLVEEFLTEYRREYLDAFKKAFANGTSKYKTGGIGYKANIKLNFIQKCVDENPSKKSMLFFHNNFEIQHISIGLSQLPKSIYCYCKENQSDIPVVICKNKKYL